MKGVGGPFDIIATIITLILGFILVYLGLISITFPPIAIVVLGIILVFLALLSIIA